MEVRKRFETIGEKSKREIFYDIIHSYDYGVQFPYSQLKTMSGFDFQTDSGRAIIYGVNKLLLKKDLKCLINIREYGYKIAKPNEQINHAAKRRTSAKRQFKKGITEINYTNQDGLTPEQKINATHLLNSMQSSLHIIRKKGMQGIEETEKAVTTQKQTIAGINTLMEEIDKIKKVIGLK